MAPCKYCRHSPCTNVCVTAHRNCTLLSRCCVCFWLIPSFATVASFRCAVSRLLDNGFEVTSYPEGTFTGLSELTFLWVLLNVNFALGLSLGLGQITHCPEKAHLPCLPRILKCQDLDIWFVWSTAPCLSLVQYSSCKIGVVECRTWPVML